jgi:ribosomal protein S12 methylthiotransferase accessory factor
MQVNVRFLDNLKVEAAFDDYTILADQPIRYKGDGMAPSPFDYFLASSALCAAYFVKVYCKAREIPTDDIRIIQNNIIDPNNRYKQDFHIQVELPESISEKDRQGILASIERCTVKRVIQNLPEFTIVPVSVLGSEGGILYDLGQSTQGETLLKGKDAPLEKTILNLTSKIAKLGINIEIASWRNPIPHVWSVHIRDADCPINYTNGKGSSRDAALCSALGEFIERLSTNYFYADYYLGLEMAHAPFVHYPNEQWFSIPQDDSLPENLMDQTLIQAFDPEGELRASHLIDTNSGNRERGICALPFTRQSDQETVFIPVNIIGNLFVSNGMSAGNSLYEARVQALSEIFERAVKNQIITEQITLPNVPQEVLQKFPAIGEGIAKLEAEGFPVLVKDASLGGRFPVMCVTLMNPRTGGVYASFGAHPLFEVALERSLTELLQGRSFEGLSEMPAPTFNEFAIKEHNNIIDHFIDSTGVISWRFFSETPDYEFVEWDFTGTTEQEFNYLMDIFRQLEKDVYIADHSELGAYACRILVPDYSEIYLPEDLIWDNNNQALKFREDILLCHSLNSKKLKSLLKRLDESELDDFMPISELIGVTFDEYSAWGMLVIAELKCHLALAIQDTQRALELSELLLTFNEYTHERKQFYQVLNTVLEINTQEDRELADYLPSLKRMYGPTLVDSVISCALGETKFYGLTPTDLNFAGLDKHERLIASYKKLQNYRCQSPERSG